MKYIANPVVVDAYKIVGLQHNYPDNHPEIQLEDGTVVPLTEAHLSRYTPVLGDYWVVQEDGYGYVNPRDVFERKYRPYEEAV